MLSSDFCRGLVSDDENDQAATNDAFDVAALHRRQAPRAGQLTVVDATNVQPEARKPLVELAREYHVPAGGDRARSAGARLPRAQPQRGPTATSARTSCASKRSSCAARSRHWSARASATSSCCDRRRRSTRRRSSAQPLWNNRRDEHGPFDIIGDVHGCFDELDAAARAARLQIGVDAMASEHRRACRRRDARRSSSATWWIAARTRPRCCGW